MYNNDVVLVSSEPGIHATANINQLTGNIECYKVRVVKTADWSEVMVVNIVYTQLTCSLVPRPSFWWVWREGEEGVWAITPGGSVQSAEIPRQVLIRNVRRKYEVRNRSTSDVVRFDYIIDEHSYLRGTAKGT